MPRYFRLLTVLLIIALSGYAVWWKLQRNRAAAEAEIRLTLEENPYVAVTAAPVTRAVLQDSFSVNGSFEPSQVAAVVPTVNGAITRLLVRNGSYVRQGAVLLEIDSEYTRNELRAAELTLAAGRRDLERMANLIGEGGVTQRQYDEVKAKVEAGEVQIESLRRRLRDAVIRAPVTGYVVAIPQRPLPVEGGLAGQGNPLFQLVNIDRVLLQVQLTAEQAAGVREGQTVDVYADLYRDRPLRGTVSAVGVTTDFLSKRYPVEITLANTRDQLIRGGMSGRAVFARGATGAAALVVPREAFAGSPREGEVFVVEGDRAFRRRVEAGAAAGDLVEVLGGLREGELVVLSGQINLQDSTRVRVIGE